jgi:nucleotide-binding universal stress UspA family protein
VSVIRRVIVGASGSPGNLPALRFAEDVARDNDALLVAVHAWTPPGGDMADRTHPSPYLRQVWADAARERLRETLDAAWGGDPDGLEIRRVLYRAEPGLALVDVADSDGDLLVVGTGRPGRLARLVGGGRVSRYCLAHTRCPVVAVPPPALAQALHTWSLRHRELTLDQVLGEWEASPRG